MFCTNCGNKLELNNNFCGGCGTKLNEQTTPNVLETENELDKLLTKYIKEYTTQYGGNISNPKTYVKEHDILSGRRGLFIILPTIVSFIFLGPAAILVAILGLLVYVLACGRIMSKEALKITSCDNIAEDNIGQLFNYLSKSFEQFPEITVTDYNDKDINFKYKNQTVHTLRFNFKNKSYNIGSKCTGKQYMKSGFQESSSHNAQNAVRVNPIIHAHIEYINSLLGREEE